MTTTTFLIADKVTIDLDHRLQIVEAKLDALEFYMSQIQLEDDAINMVDYNLENLLAQFSRLNTLRGK